VSIPDTLLLESQQNPSTFIYFIHRLIPQLNENIPVECFVIIQNKKLQFLQNVAQILHLDIHISNVTRNDFVETIRSAKRSSESTTSHKRERRSWSGFWSSIFGTATSDQIHSVYENEVEILQEERNLQKTVTKLSESNNQIYDNIKKVSTNLDVLSDRQKSLFTHLKAMISEEDKEIQSLVKIAKTQGHTTSIITEYLSLETQIIFILDTLRSFTTQVNSILTGVLDISQIPTGPLRSVLPNNFVLSIKSIKAEFNYDSQGYFIKYTVPKLSEPFYIYTIRQIPFLNGNHWYRIAYVQKRIILNSLNEYI
jgi:hypothetical protein